MSEDRPKRPASPSTTSDLLDYIALLTNEQVNVFKCFGNGMLRSSYAITHIDKDEFDMFVSIEDRWVTTKRKKFIGFIVMMMQVMLQYFLIDIQTVFL